MPSCVDVLSRPTKQYLYGGKIEVIWKHVQDVSEKYSTRT